MTLSEEAESRLADLVALQPTKNGELQDRWDMESGSEVHQYLESELKDYYYRDENSLICATPEAAEIVGIDVDEEVLRVPELQARIVDVLAGPEEEPQSVVSVLHDLEDAGFDSETDAVRSALRSLEDRGVVEIVQKTVPTFRLAVERDTLTVEVLDDPAEA
ncbi:hypothetical protein HWV07_05755 [Natronomonas salina]|uniref:DUF5797 family protein n=1 Tax=Natronomonas salina TaxID=1710540 RepID=UPI0015B5E882|nr:DUF5797 family protein [Natronomonas salina]QLD88563.1 hypothetical protein HWV07_05755 [Natronomonas salina]